VTPTRAASLAAVLCLAACGDGARARPETDPPPADARPADAASADAMAADALLPDAAPADAARDALIPDAALPDAAPDASPPLAPQNAWGPAARLVDMQVPAGPDAARRAGCAVFGTNVGTGLYNLVILAGGIHRFFQPDLQGRVPLVLLLQARGWPPGAPVTDVPAFDLAILQGAQDAANRFLYRRDAFTDADPSQPVSLFAGAHLEFGGWIAAPPATFPLPVPTPGGYVLTLPLGEARLTGRVFVDGPGFGVADGLITGYVADATLLDAVGRIRAACATDAPPAICALVGGVIHDRSDAEIRDLLVGQAGGFDAYLDEAGHPRDCDPAHPCNALSACLQFTAEGVTVEGIADP
jgi:hypothetical protein